MSREKELEIVNNATPGPWEATSSEVTMNDRSLWRIGDPKKPSAFQAVMKQIDAEFIATFNPARVRELLQENHELEERHSLERLEIERLRSDLESAKDLADDYNEEILASHARLAAVERLHEPVEDHRKSAQNCTATYGNPWASGNECFACSEGERICYRCKEIWPCDDIKAARGE